MQRGVYSSANVEADTIPFHFMPNLTTSSPAEFDRPLRLDHLAEKVARVRRSEQFARVGTGGINALAGLVALATALGILEYIFHFDIPGRTALFWGGFIGGGAILGRTLIGPVGRLTRLLPGESDEVIARRVGAAIPEVGDRLLNTLQLGRIADQGEPRDGSDLARAAVAMNLPPLMAHDYSVIIDAGDRRRALLLLFSATITLLGVASLLGGELPVAWERITEYRTHYQKPAPFRLSVMPGDIRIESGESVEFVAHAVGTPPGQADLLLVDSEGNPIRRLSMQEERPGEFHLLLDDIRQDGGYRVEAAGIESATFRIRVIERPDITSLHVSLIPPRYTRLRNERLPEGVGHITGIRGTQVTVTARTSVPVASAELVQILPSSVAGSFGVADTIRRPMVVDGDRLTGGFTLTRNGEYHIVATTDDGTRGSSGRYGIAVTLDRSPSITLMQPALGLDVDESNLIPVQVRISDDFGFSALRVRYRLVSSRYSEPWEESRQVKIPIPIWGRTELEIPWLWDLTSERFMPEDEVEAWVEVLDNDPFLGPKSARSTRFLLRYPSFEEILEESERTRDAAASDLSRLVKDADQARREMERLNRELAKELAARKGEAGWEEKRKLQDLMRRHEEMQGKLQDVAEELKAVAEKLRQAEAISPETLREYRELQELFEQVENPELRRSMEQIAREMEKMSPEEMMEAMKNYEFNEEEFRKAIERTREALERMKTAEEFDRLAATARHLADEQEKLEGRIERERSPTQRQELATEQSRIAEQSAELQKKGGEVAEKMKQRGAPEGLEQLQRENPAARMNQAAAELREGDRNEAGRQGEQARESLEKFADAMEQARREMDRNRSAERLQTMKKSLKELLDLAKEQEELQSRTSSTPSNSPELGQQAREQNSLKKRLEKLTDQVSSPQEPSFVVTPQMAKNLGDAMGQMGDAQEALEGRRSQSAASSQGEAVSSMAAAAGQMASQIEGMEGMQGEGSGEGSGMGEGSMRSRIQQLAAQQQMLNMAMGGEQGQGEEGRGGPDGEQGSGGSGGSGQGDEGDRQGMAGRLHEAQQQIGKSIEELRKEAAASGGRRKSLADDLEQAARQIEEVLDDLADGHITTETRQRQDRILSRMLDALKSSRERDFEQKRESSPGSDISRESPPDLPPTNPSNRDNSTLPGDESEQGYSPEYRELIRRYLESLD